MPIWNGRRIGGHDEEGEVVDRGEGGAGAQSGDEAGDIAFHPHLGIGDPPGHRHGGLGPHRGRQGVEEGLVGTVGRRQVGAHARQRLYHRVHRARRQRRRHGVPHGGRRPGPKGGRADEQAVGHPEGPGRAHVDHGPQDLARFIGHPFHAPGDPVAAQRCGPGPDVADLPRLFDRALDLGADAVEIGQLGQGARRSGRAGGHGRVDGEDDHGDEHGQQQPRPPSVTAAGYEHVAARLAARGGWARGDLNPHVLADTGT